jgi:hypothetical protein
MISRFHQIRLLCVSPGLKDAIRKTVPALLLLTFSVSFFCLALSRSSADSGSQSIDFNRDIRPILSDNCFACHGPDEKQRKAGLHFDTKEGAFGKTGVIVPGNAAASRLIRRITAADPEMRMPPPDSGRSLTDNQKALIARWIDQGAKWETHWAYVTPVRSDPPKVAAAGWPRNPIDNFVLARLEKEGMSPSPEADRATLLRRVTLDLTGLPPTPAEIASFLADKSPEAYETRVDRLLRSPHYGERMAMQWLDLARYADTHGYHIDSHRDMWPWRDWVINAFNRNMPFDQFTTEQLAGDLLPGSTVEQEIASGFNRNHMVNFEGGAIPEEYQVEYVVDRVETTSRTWMAMTMGCARCHNHKYDPISQREFYQFYAFFNSIAEEGLDGKTGNAKPILKLPTPTQKSQSDELDAGIRIKEDQLSDKNLNPILGVWMKSLEGAPLDEPRSGLVAHYGFDGSLVDSSGGYHHGRRITGDPTFGSGPVGRALSLDGNTTVSFRDVGVIDRGDPFSIAVWLKPEGALPISAFQKIEDSTTRRGYEMLFDGIELVGIQKRAGFLTIRLNAHWPDNSIQIRTRQRITFGEWCHITLVYGGTGTAQGIKVYVDGKLSDTEALQDSLTGSISTAADLRIGSADLGSPFKGQVDDLRIYNRVLSGQEAERIAVDYPVRAALSGAFEKPSKDDTARIRDYFLTHVAPDQLRKAYLELGELKSRKEKLDKDINSVMVMSELGKPRDTFMLGRGDYRNPAEKVTPGVPAMLPPPPKDAAPNRLTLARWLVDPANPLTARVAVNQYWQMYFGTGIVKTTEDFGSQGEPPSNPELLDWLATEFLRSGWDVRAMQRLIVTSAAYRQSSKASSQTIEKDPENRFLARAPRIRLPAETVRDNALAISGLLNPLIGGPSVFPYQPKGLWEEMAFGEGFSAQSYVQSSGKDLYRRSLYTFWKRTVPPPSLATFDAPDREKCTARRTLTNTPLQALVLMNDPTYVEAARALATQVLTHSDINDISRLAYAFKLATARPPAARETQVLRELLSQQLQRYHRDRKAAIELIRLGDSRPHPGLDPRVLAAWTIVASSILNLDETITRQ